MRLSVLNSNRFNHKFVYIHTGTMNRVYVKHRVDVLVLLYLTFFAQFVMLKNRWMSEETCNQRKLVSVVNTHPGVQILKVPVNYSRATPSILNRPPYCKVRVAYTGDVKCYVSYWTWRNVWAVNIYGVMNPSAGFITDI